MNLSSVITSVLQRGAKPLYATSSGLLAQQTRNTYILRRKFPLKLHKLGGKPGKFNNKNFIYDLVEDTNIKKQEPIEIILTTYVAGVGGTGDTIKVSPNAAYSKFLLPGLAVYANPDNVEKYKDVIEKAKSEVPVYSSTWAPRTLDILSTHLLSVLVSQFNPWTVEKYHIRYGFRKVGIYVADEAITMPERPITGPDMEKENKEFYITVTINNREEVKVRCRLHHHTTQENKKMVTPEYWLQSVPAIFPEDQPVLDAMPKHRLLQKQNAAE